VTLSRRVVAEGLGMAFLLAAVVGSGIMAEKLASGNAQHGVMTAIELCRTTFLGGHLEQCDQCGHQRNA
jgi:glycerol uptake facilitator-like aquaporin